MDQIAFWLLSSLLHTLAKGESEQVFAVSIRRNIYLIYAEHIVKMQQF